MDDKILTRQGIFDKKLEVFGYELLLSPQDKQQLANDKEAAGFSGEELASFLGKKAAFTNCSELIFKDDFQTKIPVEMIIELDANVADSEELLDKVAKLKEQGYQIAFSNFSLKHKDNPLLKQADFVKVDLLEQDDEALKCFMGFLENLESKIIAEKVETYASFNLCKELGFDYFQGNFLCCPDLETKQGESSNGLMTMQLLNKLQIPDVTPDEIEQALSQDPRLAYKLIHVVNSPAYGLTRKIESLREAVIYMGLNQIKRWTSLVALSSAEGKPQELMTTAMIRAKMCEVLAEEFSYKDSDSSFTVGLFSTLDALFDKDLNDLLADICISDHIKQALLKHEGEMGKLLKKVIAYEHADWYEFEEDNFDYKPFISAYADSVAWADSFSESLRA